MMAGSEQDTKSPMKNVEPIKTNDKLYWLFNFIAVGQL